MAGIPVALKTINDTNWKFVGAWYVMPAIRTWIGAGRAIPNTPLFSSASVPRSSQIWCYLHWVFAHPAIRHNTYQLPSQAVFKLQLQLPNFVCSPYLPCPSFVCVECRLHSPCMLIEPGLTCCCQLGLQRRWRCCLGCVHLSFALGANHIATGEQYGGSTHQCFQHAPDYIDIISCDIILCYRPNHLIDQIQLHPAIDLLTLGSYNILSAAYASLTEATAGIWEISLFRLETRKFLRYSTVVSFLLDHFLMRPIFPCYPVLEFLQHLL